MHSPRGPEQRGEPCKAPTLQLFHAALGAVRPCLLPLRGAGRTPGRAPDHPLRIANSLTPSRGTVTIAANMDQPLIFFHISDTHVGSTKDYAHRGYRPYGRTELLIQDMRRLGIKPDFVMHTGDVCGDKDHHATTAHYELVRPIFSAIDAPWYYLVGNHDCAESMEATLNYGPHEVFFSSGREKAYKFSSRSHDCFALLSSIPTKREGIISKGQLAAFEESLSRSSSPAWVFLHHPPLSMGSPWMDGNMLLANGMELHQILRKRREQVQGVFFGHIHQPWQFCREGINYFSSPGAIFQFSTLPSDTSSNLEPQSAVGYSVVHYRQGQVQVNARTVPLSQASPAL